MTTLRVLLSEAQVPLKPALGEFLTVKAQFAGKVIAGIASGLTAYREYRSLVMHGVADRDAAAEAISHN